MCPYAFRNDHVPRFQERVSTHSLSTLKHYDCTSNTVGVQCVRFLSRAVNELLWISQRRLFDRELSPQYLKKEAKHHIIFIVMHNTLKNGF